MLFVSCRASDTPNSIYSRNRYLACQKLGIEPLVKEWNGIGSKLDFVISENLIRRHLTATQRATLSLDLMPLAEKEAKERHDRLSGTRSNPGEEVSQKFDTPPIQSSSPDTININELTPRERDIMSLTPTQKALLATDILPLAEKESIERQQKKEDLSQKIDQGKGKAIEIVGEKEARERQEAGRILGGQIGGRGRTKDENSFTEKIPGSYNTVKEFELTPEHLTSTQKAVLATDLLPLSEKESKERQEAIEKRDKGMAREIVAEKLHVNDRYISDAKAIVTKAPELKPYMQSSQIEMQDAKRIANLSEDKKGEVIERKIESPDTPAISIIRDVNRAEKHGSSVLLPVRGPPNLFPEAIRS